MTLELTGKLNNYGFCIKKSDINNEIIDFLRTKFIAIPTSNDDDYRYNKDKTEKSKQFSVFYEDTSYIILPKFSYKLEFNNIDNITYNNKIYTNIKFKIKKILYKNISAKFKTKRNPYDYQQIIIDYTLKLFKECDKNKIPKGGILKLDCGAGKTVLGNILSSVIGLKTLIIVPQQPILDQWIEEFTDHSNARVGIIQGDKIDVEDKDVVIAMLKSLSMKNYDPKIFEGFGVVIYDEVHHLGARVYSKSLQKSSFEYTIGLSATPERIDDTMFVVNWNIGDVIYSMQRKLNYKILIKRFIFNSISPLFKTKKRWFNGRQAINPDGTLKNILSITERNNLIVSTIIKLIFSNRKILILSHSVEHLSVLCAMTDRIISKIKNNTDSNKYVDEKEKLKKNENNYNTYIYTGETKKDKRTFIRENGNIIFATIQLVEEGFNIKRLDTIVFTTPVSIPSDKNTRQIKSTKKLIQSIGRILRKNELDDLLDIPLVVDICDNLSIYNTWAEKRLKIYNEKKWFVQDYNFCDTKFQNDDNDTLNSNNTYVLRDNTIIFKELSDKEFILKNLIIKKEDTDKEFDISNCIDSDDLESLEKTKKEEKKLLSYDF
jgi:superfamily II DNA or RNA helicase